MKTLKRKRNIVGLIVILAGLSLAAQSQSGADAVYKSKCTMCHGVDGSGSTPAGKAMGAKDFRAPEVVKETDAELQDAIQKGRNKMPAYQGKLKADDVQALVKYIRQLQK